MTLEQRQSGYRTTNDSLLTDLIKPIGDGFSVPEVVRAMYIGAIRAENLVPEHNPLHRISNREPCINPESVIRIKHGCNVSILPAHAHPVHLYFTGPPADTLPGTGFLLCRAQFRLCTISR